MLCKCVNFHDMSWTPSISAAGEHVLLRNLQTAASTRKCQDESSPDAHWSSHFLWQATVIFAGFLILWCIIFLPVLEKQCKRMSGIKRFITHGAWRLLKLLQVLSHHRQGCSMSLKGQLSAVLMPSSLLTPSVCGSLQLDASAFIQDKRSAPWQLLPPPLVCSVKRWCQRWGKNVIRSLIPQPVVNQLSCCLNIVSPPRRLALTREWACSQSCCPTSLWSCWHLART